jgi:hypothetical protein
MEFSIRTLCTGGGEAGRGGARRPNGLLVCILRPGPAEAALSGAGGYLPVKDSFEVDAFSSVRNCNRSQD